MKYLSLFICLLFANQVVCQLTIPHFKILKREIYGESLTYQRIDENQFQSLLKTYGVAALGIDNLNGSMKEIMSESIDGRSVSQYKMSNANNYLRQVKRELPNFDLSTYENEYKFYQFIFEKREKAKDCEKMLVDLANILRGVNMLTIEGDSFAYEPNRASFWIDAYDHDDYSIRKKLADMDYPQTIYRVNDKLNYLKFHKQNTCNDALRQLEIAKTLSKAYDSFLESKTLIFIDSAMKALELMRDMESERLIKNAELLCKWRSLLTNDNLADMICQNVEYHKRIVKGVTDARLKAKIANYAKLDSIQTAAKIEYMNQERKRVEWVKLYRGSRGGCFYYSQSGNKVYVNRNECD